MTRVCVTAYAALVVSCTKELTSQPIIPPRPASDSRPATDTPPPSSWRSEFCRIEPASDAPLDATKTLRFYGECNFPHSGSAKCQESGDDYFAAAKRLLAGGRVFSFFANVEHYDGPGDYRDVQISVIVRDSQVPYRKAQYRWSNYEASAIVVGGAHPVVEFSNAWLAPEPGTPATGWIILEGTLDCSPSVEEQDRATAQSQGRPGSSEAR